MVLPQISNLMIGVRFPIFAPLKTFNLYKGITMECITLANDIISMYSTNMIIGLMLFTGMGACLGVIFTKTPSKEKILF